MVAEARHPLAATLMRRSMIADTPNRSKARRVRHAAGHLAGCRSRRPSLGWGTAVPAP
ncbi:DUF6880 family protein [Paracoccus yibinensis]|uniref:DUF6880 family protein n=1 Tax=Paracoccus yibinensis TaxID=3068891 RepID=UPI00358DFE46